MLSTLPRFPTTAPTIAALPDSPDRPLWSVMIPVYNCAAFLPDALRTVLQQDRGPEAMQIQVVDDASTDADVEALVAELGGGRVEYFRQAANVGSLRNFETCLNRSRGHLIHLLHGDDRVRPGFYEKITQLFDTYPSAGAAFSNYAFIDAAGDKLYMPPMPAPEEGLLEGWLLRIAQQQYIQYVAIAVRRTAYEKVGSFYGNDYGEDWEMWVRIARDHPFAYTPEVLAEYRVHTNSISWEKARSGGMILDLNQVIDRIEQHLPPKDQKRITAISRKYYAIYSVELAYRIFHETNNLGLTQAQLKRSLDMSRHPSIYYRVARFYLGFLKRKLTK